MDLSNSSTPLENRIGYIQTLINDIQRLPSLPSLNGSDESNGVSETELLVLLRIVSDAMWLLNI